MLLNTTRVDHVPGFQKRSTQNKLLSLYLNPPEEEVSIDDFEQFASDRLQLLRGIESLKTRGIEGVDYKNKLKALEEKYMPLTTKNPDQNIDILLSNQRKDQISHFILRLAYCRSDELRRWFLTHECHLLKFRLEDLSEVHRAEFMSSNGMDFEVVDHELKLRLQDQLIGLAGVEDKSTFNSTPFYKVPFGLALSLVGSRSVYISSGSAYIPLSKLLSIIVNKFRMFLSKGLAEAIQTFQIAAADPRIGSLVKNMSKQYVGSDFNSDTKNAGDKLLPEHVDRAAELNMPLCMKYLHLNLKKDSKLKHWGRLQYGLFLKGAGMDLESANIFWQSYFTKLISAESFQKQYAYSFRHMYGKEGSRRNYTPFSCLKIIMGSPPEVGAYHGCPYRTMNDNQLTALLGSLRIGGAEVTEMVKTAKTGNPQIACQRHFDIAHPNHQSVFSEHSSKTHGDTAANHPNQWFQASVLYHKIKAGVAIKSEDTSNPSFGEDEFAADRLDENVPISNNSNILDQDVTVE